MTFIIRPDMFLPKIGKMPCVTRHASKHQRDHLKSGKFRLLIMVLSVFSILLFDDSALASGKKNYKVSRRDKAFGIHFVDEKCGWIVGDSGLVLKTTDGGDNWQRLKVSDDTYNDVFFLGQKGWIVGGSRLILHTDNGGKTWTNQTEIPSQSREKTALQSEGACPGIESPARSLMKVFFLDQNKGFTAGADGIILRTENGGASWEDVSVDCISVLPEILLMNGIVSINLYDIFFISSASGWIVGDSGAILHSKDGGRRWHLKNIGLLPPLFSIAFLDEKKGWAVGQNGFSLITEDGGETWETILIDEKNSLYAIKFYNRYGVIVGDQATIFLSDDAGVSWEKVVTRLHPPFPWFAGAWIFPSNSAKVLSVGKGIILKTEVGSRK